jgi:chromosome condensin MukBEF ATPase and DNA-binding subunit MukB
LFWKELFKDQTPEEAARYKAHAEKMNAQRIKNFNDLIARYEENISSNNRRINETVPMLLNTWDSAVKEGKISKEQAEIEKLKVKSSLPEFHNANKRAQEMIVKYKAEIAKIK